MNNLKLIIKREVIAKVRNKSFIVMTFLSPLLFIGMGSLIFYLSKINNETVKNIAYVDASQHFKASDFKSNKIVKYVNLTSLGLDSAKKKVKEGSYYGLLYIPKSDNIDKIASNIQFFSKKSPNMILVSSIRKKAENRLRFIRLNNLGIDIDKLNASKVNVSIKLSNFSGVKTSKLVNGLKIGVGSIAGYLIMMFIIIYGNSVMRSVIEEKTSRIIEVIISSVKPFNLMLGKIVGNGLACLLQFFIWGILFILISIVASTFLGIDIMNVHSVAATHPDKLAAINSVANGEVQLIFKEIFNLPLLTMFILFILYFIGGFLLYSSIYAAIGAAVDNETDTQQFMLPVILPLMLGVYIGFASVISDPNGPVSVAFSIIPLTSPIVMLMRIPFGVPWWQITLSLSLLIVTFFVLVWFVAKIYRIGILMYGKKPTYKDLIKWMRY